MLEGLSQVRELFTASVVNVYDKTLPRIEKAIRRGLGAFIPSMRTVHA